MASKSVNGERRARPSRTTSLSSVERKAALRFIRWPEVAALTGLTKSVCYGLIRKGQFPEPIVLSDGGRSVAWVESEVENWLEQRVLTTRAPGYVRKLVAGPGRGHTGPLKKNTAQQADPPPQPLKEEKAKKSRRHTTEA